MPRPTAIAMLALAALLAVVSACSGDDDTAPAATADPASTTTAPSAEADAGLAALMLEAGDLPGDFAASSTIDDTITAFCAGEDATAGLQASAREIRGFTRTGGGSSVIQLAFRFRDGGAPTFVDQAGAILDRCSGVPDATGLAFDYDALSPEVDAIVADVAEAHVGRHGINVGSQRLSIDVVVLRQGDVGQLVAVLGLDLARADLDDLASSALRAVVARTAHA